MTGSDWLTKYDLTPPPPPGGGLPLGKRVPNPPSENAVRIDATYLDRGEGSGRLQLTNYSPFAIHDLRFEVPEEAGPSFHVHADLPVAKLPSGKSVGFITSRTMGPGADHFELKITGRTPDGQPLEATAFLSLVG